LIPYLSQYIYLLNLFLYWEPYKLKLQRDVFHIPCSGMNIVLGMIILIIKNSMFFKYSILHRTY